MLRHWKMARQYDFMVSKFYQSRSLVLEAMVVAILGIELIKVFRGG